MVKFPVKFSRVKVFCKCLQLTLDPIVYIVLNLIRSSSLTCTCIACVQVSLDWVHTRGERAVPHSLDILKVGEEVHVPEAVNGQDW